MQKSIIYIILTIFLISFGNSLADRRYFGRSYLAYTLPAGGFELEVWNTGRIGKDMGYYYRFQPRFEFEYGVTDRLSASLYFNFDQVTSEQNLYESKSFGFSSSSVELRYRLTNPGDIFVDPALYFEFAYGGDELEYESKIILSKRFENLITTLNITSEIEREVIESENESAFELTGGIMYEVSPVVALGLELRHDRTFEDIYEEEESNATFIGPSFNFQGSSFYLTFNFLAQVAGSPSTKNNLDLAYHEQYEFRTIIGVEL
jgi:hypothetical protein